MSIVPAVFYLSRRVVSVDALPLSAAAVDRLTPSPCDDMDSDDRTISDIVWSCLTTIFSCTWVAIHSNIPAPSESSFEIGLHHFGVVFMAIIAPELVIMWAMRQWIVSRRLAKEQHRMGWSQTHGFFAIMGGFMLFTGQEALRVISPTEIVDPSPDGEITLPEGNVAFPEITKKEIDDKSKGDIISKGFVIVQTGWFVCQCIARGVKHLPITELELVTLAFAVLNFTTYALWWNKPLGVQCAHRVQIIGEVVKDGTAGDEERPTDIFIRFRMRFDQLSPVWKKIILPFMPFVELGLSITGAGIEPGAKKVPSFYAGELTDREGWKGGLTSAAVAIVFGAVHCIAWSFEFPSEEKEILWRACSLAITCFPVTIVSFGILGTILVDIAKMRRGFARGVIHIFGSCILTTTYIVMPVIYIFARAILLVEAFILLRSLPCGAFKTVKWTTFIPHV
ncbi:hypothetical protein BD410DRAFT_858077 [Rickenella mellea]|uniref:Uncharacterized protein n=1 Tax=Rickenella mellea TaxID=50990 RepID=A0A4Y7PGV4_9AGAM|nr:hypothetical protein BD410DRAFT_858077 [Rickenella mellea]